jgi:hypothetical protein
VSRRTRLMPQPTRPGRAEVTVVTIQPVVLAEAIGLAEGDPRRIRLQADGSVVVLNH